MTRVIEDPESKVIIQNVQRKVFLVLSDCFDKTEHMYFLPSRSGQNSYYRMLWSIKLFVNEDIRNFLPYLTLCQKRVMMPGSFFH